jgi:undecaprenyl diphosphate synthase
VRTILGLPELIEGHLFAAGLSDPGRVVRTSGEIRSSNFLLWQTSLSWWFFSSKMWPDYGPDDLQAALGAALRADERRLAGP